MTKLSDLKVNLSLGVRPSRVLCDYVKKPSVNCILSSALLNELSSDMPVVRCSYSVDKNGLYEDKPVEVEFVSVVDMCIH